MRTPFLGQFYKSRSTNLDEQRAVNLYLELAENKQGKQKGMLLMTPGLDPLVLLGASVASSFVNTPAQWFAGQSCEIMSWPLTASGANPPVTIDITGTISTLTGPQGNLKSNTLALDIDAATGNQYVLTQSLLLDNKWDINIPVFAHGANGNIAPIINITPTNAEFIDSNSELGFGGLCLDVNKNIYVGFGIAASMARIWQIAAGSNGNVTATLIVSDNTYNITSLSYDATNNLIWASGYGSSPFHSLAKSYTTAGAANSTITTTAQNFAGEVFIGPTGQIVLAGTGTGSQSVVQVFPSGSSGAAVASQTITINPAGAQGPVISCAAMDSAGLLYVGPIFDVSGNEVIFVYAAGVTGTDPATLRQFYSSLFVNMADSTPTDIQQIVVR